MTQISIKNFQSIKDLSLSFNGFCVVTGKSDIGKSAIRRAISAVLFNNWNKSYISNNAKETYIDFKRNDLFVSAQKSSSVNKFVVNNKVFDKIGKEAPPLSCFNADLNITTQLESLYMVSYKDTDNTKIFNELFGIDKLERAQLLCGQDLRLAKSQLKDTQSQLESLMPELDNLKTSFNAYQSLYNELKSKIASYTLLDDFLSKNRLKIQLKQELSLYDDFMCKAEQFILLSRYINISNKLLDTESKGKANKQQLNKLNAVIDSVNKHQELSYFISLSQRLTTLHSVLSSTKAYLDIDFLLLKSLNKFDSLNELSVSINNLETDLHKVNKELDSFPKCDKCNQFIRG